MNKDVAESSIQIAVSWLRLGIETTGALIIAVLSNGLILTGVSDIWQYIIKGLVIIGAVALDHFRSKGLART